jgi:hypothetical protein
MELQKCRVGPGGLGRKAKAAKARRRERGGKEARSRGRGTARDCYGRHRSGRSLKACLPAIPSFQFLFSLLPPPLLLLPSPVHHHHHLQTSTPRAARARPYVRPSASCGAHSLPPPVGASGLAAGLRLSIPAAAAEHGISGIGSG